MNQAYEIHLKRLPRVSAKGDYPGGSARSDRVYLRLL